jgi:hypothetical protein
MQMLAQICRAAFSAALWRILHSHVLPLASVRCSQPGNIPPSFDTGSEAAVIKAQAGITGRKKGECLCIVTCYNGAMQCTQHR